MAITITVDNDRGTNGIQSLLADETVGLQTPGTTDDGNEIDVTLTAAVGGTLGGFQTAFNSFLNGLSLTDAQKVFARDHDGASSASNFVLVTTSANEKVTDLFFSDAAGNALDGDPVLIDHDGNPATPRVPMTTLDGTAVFLHSSGDFCIATTSATAGSGRIVAAFYLNENLTDHKSAQVQMVVFEPLLHPNSADPDDALNFTDVLQVSAAGSLSFDFDKLQSGSSLWAAVGNAAGGVLVTGIEPLIDAAGKKTNVSDVIHTSQGGLGATIGVNNQLFDEVGEAAVFTFVTGFTSLLTADDGATGDYAVDVPTTNKVELPIDYSGYIPNVTGAGFLISQSQGSPATPKNLDVNVFRTNNASPEEGFGYVYSNPTLKTGNAFDDDLKVAVATVTITNDLGVEIGTWSIAPSGAQFANGSTQAGVKVTIGGNDSNTANDHNIDIDGVFGLYTVAWTVVSGATMNRFSLVSEGGQFDVGRVDVTRAIPGGTAVGDQLFVEDDGPALTGVNASEKVVEDALSIAALDGDLSTGNGDGDGDGDEAIYTNAELQVTLNGGTDAPPIFALNLGASGAVKDIAGNSLRSLGQTVEFAVDGSGAVWGMAGGRAVFKLWQSAGTATPNDPSDDAFSVDLMDQVDHPDNSGDDAMLSIDLTPAFSAKDADGDRADLNGAGNDKMIIRLNIENDVPLLSGQTATKKVVEDELSVAVGDGDLSTGISDGDGDSDQANFVYNDFLGVVTVGGDEPIVVDMNTAFAGKVREVDGTLVLSRGEEISYQSVAAGQINAIASGGRIVFTVTRTAGAATPGDSTDDIYTVDLRDQVDHDPASGDNGALTIDLAPLFLISDFDGDDLDLNGPGDNLSPIQLVIENDIPALSGQNATIRVEEDELSTSASPADLSNGVSNGGAFSDEAIFTNAALQAVLTPGADEPVTFALDLAVAPGSAVLDSSGAAVLSKGAAVTYAVSGSVIQGVAAGRVVFTLTQTAGAATAGDPSDDAFTFDLRDQLDHALAGGDAALKTLDLTPAFLATDFDGDAVDLNGAANTARPIRVEVENDVPILSGQNAIIRVEEDELSTSASPADLSNGVSNGGAFSDEAIFTNAALQAVVTPGADEPVTFALNLSVAPGSAVLDSSGAAVLSKGAAVTYAVSGSVIQGVAAGRVVFTLTQTAGAATAGDPSDDAFTFDLLDQLDHVSGSGDDALKTLDLTPAFAASDFDGDAVDLNGAANTARPIRVEVENDVPILSGQNAIIRVDEDELSIASGGDLSTGIGDGDATDDETDFTYAALNAIVTPGADEPVGFALNLAVTPGSAVLDSSGAAVASKGAAVTYAVSGSVIQGVAAGRVVFAITQTAGAATASDPTDDVFTFDLRDQLDHAAGGDGAIRTLDLTPVFLATDFDGDAVDLNGAANDQRPIRVEVENDVPAITAQIEDGIVDFAPGPTGTVTNSLNGAIGGDDNNATNDTAAGLKQYTITSFSAPKNVFANLDGVLSADKTKVTYYLTSVAADQNSSTAVYELSLNQPANSGAGSYTFTVLQPPPNTMTTFDFTDLPSGQNLLGVIATDKLVLSKGGLLVMPSNVDINDGEAGESNDGSMTNTSGTVNTSKGGGPVTIGNANQAFDANVEGAWFAYVDNPLASVVGGLGLTQTSADLADTIRFDGTVEVTKASVEIVQASGNGASRPGPGLQIKAYDINPQTVGVIGDAGVETGSRNFILNPSASGAQVNIIGVKILDATGKVIEFVKDVGAADGVYMLQDSGDTGTDVTSADNSAVGIEWVQDSAGVYSVKVTNLKANYTVEFETQAKHDLALVQHLSGSYDIGGFNILQGQDAPDQLFDFSVLITDYDGDADGGTADAFANFSVGIDGTGVNNDNVVAGLVPVVPIAPLAILAFETSSPVDELWAHDVRTDLLLV